MNYFKSLIVFTCITFCMASCSDTPEYQNLIPQNAQVVVSLNLKDILSKTNLPDGAQNQIKALAATQIAGSDLDQIANIIDGKQGVGIDISEPFYFFSSPGVEAALTMKVESQEKLDEFMDLLARQEICDKPKEKDGLKWTELMHEVTVAYNSETLVLLALTSEANAKITIKKLFNQSPDDSFCKTDSYNKLYSKNGEIRFYANGGLLGSNESVRPLLGSLLPDGVSPEYAEIITDITLGKGRLDLATELFSSNDDVQNHLEKQDKMFEKINGDFIAAPNDFVCWIGADVDGEKFIDRLMGIDGVKGAFAFLERGIDIESILKSIKGDVAFTIPTINDTPDFVMTAKTKNTDFLKDVSGWQETMKDFGYSMVENSKNNFSLKMPGESTINWGVEGDNLYFASENSFFKSAFTEKSDRLNSVENEIKGSIFYMYINPDPIFANFPYINNLSNGILTNINRVTLKADNARCMTYSLVLNDDSEYFLTQVLGFTVKAIEEQYLK